MSGHTGTRVLKCHESNVSGHPSTDMLFVVNCHVMAFPKHLLIWEFHKSQPQTRKNHKKLKVVAVMSQYAACLEVLPGASNKEE